MSSSGREPLYALPGTLEECAHGVRLVGGECSACGAKVFPRSKVCSVCWSEDIKPVTLAEQGRLYSYSVVHAARKGWRTPYAIAYVDLDDGVRVCAPLEVSATDLPPLGSVVSLVVGVLRSDAEGRSVLSHRFAPVKGES